LIVIAEQQLDMHNQQQSTWSAWWLSVLHNPYLAGLSYLISLWSVWQASF